MHYLDLLKKNYQTSGFGRSTQAPPSFRKVPGLPGVSPNFPEVPRRLPGTSLTADFKGNPEFPRLARKSKKVGYIED